MGDEIDLTTFPSPSTAERVAAVAVQIAGALLPFGSGPAGALLSALLPELSKDRIAWIELLAAKVLQHAALLEAHGERIDSQEARILSQEENLQEVDLDELVKRPAFRAAFVRTSDIALRDTLRKKWEALSNIVVNSALPNAPDDALQMMFLGNMASFGEWHLYLLKFFNSPRKWPLDVAGAAGGQLGQLGRTVRAFEVIKDEIPELVDRQEFCEQVIADLTTSGLITLDANKIDYPTHPGPHTFNAMMGKGPTASAAPLTTVLGVQFLNFIADPNGSCR